MCGLGYDGTVLVARDAGGYDRIPIGRLDKSKYESARKVLWGKRKRYWKLKEKKYVRMVEYTRQFTFDKGGREYFSVDAVVYEGYPGSDDAAMKRLKGRSMTRLTTRMIDRSFRGVTKNGIENYYAFLDNFDFTEHPERGGWMYRSGVSYVDDLKKIG